MHIHARCGCFQVAQTRQIDFKMSTRNVNNYKQKTFCDIFVQLHTQDYKATTKQKKSKESQTRLMS